jgi:hypothetical protein
VHSSAAFSARACHASSYHPSVAPGTVTSLVELSGICSCLLALSYALTTRVALVPAVEDLVRTLRRLVPTHGQLDTYSALSEILCGALAHWCATAVRARSLPTPAVVNVAGGLVGG